MTTHNILPSRISATNCKMEKIPQDKLLLYNNDTLKSVRKSFDLDKPGVMEDAVTILEEWVNEQSHFTKNNFDRRYLENIIIASKGSVERAKQRLDRACTYRTLKPELFRNYDIKHFFQNDLKHLSHALLPKMTKNHERVYILKNFGQKFEPTVITSFIRMVPNYGEYLRLNDYAASYYVVLDYIDANLVDLVTKLTVSDIQDAVAYVLDCCGFRLKALYFVSSSKLIEIGVAITKQVLSAKLAERVHVLKTRELVKDYIDIDILPEEYGGNERSLDQLHEKWLEVLTSEDHVEYMRNINSARTDENLRQKDSFNDQYMGMPGTFRMLSVD